MQIIYCLLIWWNHIEKNIFIDKIASWVRFKICKNTYVLNPKIINDKSNNNHHHNNNDINKNRRIPSTILISSKIKLWSTIQFGELLPAPERCVWIWALIKLITLSWNTAPLCNIIATVWCPYRMPGTVKTATDLGQWWPKVLPGHFIWFACCSFIKVLKKKRLNYFYS